MGAFAKLATSFQSKITVCWEGRTGNGKSIWDLMTMAAPQGSELLVQVEGPDAPAALDALIGLLQNLESYSDDDELTESAPPGSLDH
jgi:phosphocarrier protein